MLEVLRDPLWQFVGAVLAVGALAASFLIFNWQKAKRAVTYDVLSRTNLLTVGEELAGKVQVLYEGEPANSISLVMLKVWNSGNQPLLASDFERPISFCVGKDARILSAVVVETDPTTLSAEIEVYERSVVVAPVLLNPTDSVTLKLLVRDIGNAICPDARIVGVKHIKLVREGTRLSLIFVGAGLALLALSAYFFASTLPPREQRPPLGPTVYLGAASFALGYASLLWSLLKLRRARRRNSRLIKRRGA